MRNALFAMLLFAPSAAAAQPRMHLVEDLRIDGAKMGFDSRPLAFLLVTPRGRMAYVDPYRFRVNFFNAAGEHIGDHGGRGTGPGEFSMIAGQGGDRADLVGGTVGDSIWLLDRAHMLGPARITYLSSKGDFLRTIEADPPRSAAPGPGADRGPSVQMVAAFADGGVLWQESFITSWRTSARADSWSSRTDSVVYVRVSRENDSERRIARVGGDPGFVTVGEVTLRAPFSENRGVVGVARDGNRVVTMTTQSTSATKGSYSLVAINARGDTAFARTYPFTGIPLAAGHIGFLIDQLIRDHDHVDANGVHEIGAQAAAELKRRLRAAVPPSQAPVKGVRVGLDNSLWLPMTREQPGLPWLVLDERGEPFATVVMPRGIGLPAQMTKSSVWVIEQRNDGPASIVRYRLVPGA